MPGMKPSLGRRMADGKVSGGRKAGREVQGTLPRIKVNRPANLNYGRGYRSDFSRAGGGLVFRPIKFWLSNSS